MAVNSFRKMTTDEELNSLGKSLIKHWKKLVHGLQLPSCKFDIKQVLLQYNKISKMLAFLECQSYGDALFCRTGIRWTYW